MSLSFSFLPLCYILKLNFRDKNDKNSLLKLPKEKSYDDLLYLGFYLLELSRIFLVSIHIMIGSNTNF